MIFTTTLLIGHFIGDFICQPRSWADTKYKNIVSLIYHIGIYTLVMGLVLGIVTFGKIPLILVALWAIINGILHLITDFITSKLFHKNWEAGNRALAINIYGLDQLIHYLCLFFTIGIMP